MEPVLSLQPNICYNNRLLLRHLCDYNQRADTEGDSEEKKTKWKRESNGWGFAESNEESSKSWKQKKSYISKKQKNPLSKGSYYIILKFSQRIYSALSWSSILEEEVKSRIPKPSLFTVWRVCLYSSKLNQTYFCGNCSYPLSPSSPPKNANS